MARASGRSFAPLTAGAREVPLSAAQHRLWMVHRLEDVGPAYNEPLGLRLTGALDRDALEAAWQDVFRRHDSLRTIFSEVDGVPRQYVIPADEVRLPCICRDTTEADLPAAIADASEQPFALNAELPIRLHLFRIAPDDHMLLLNIHHIVTDAWSTFRVIVPELVSAYTARVSGERFDPPPPLQYADYVIEQQQRSDDYEEKLEFWRASLAGLPPHIELPTDRARPPRMTYRGERVRVIFDVDLHARIIALARRANATVFTVVQAAIAATLARLGAGADIPLGTAVGGRSKAFEAVVGFFVNTVVVRADLSGRPTFLELLTRLHDVNTKAFARGDVPFDAVVDALNPRRSLGRPPLFQVMLGFSHYTPDEMEAPGLRITRTPIRMRTAKFDLAFVFGQRLGPNREPATISGWVEGNTDLFERSTIERLARRLDRLVREVVAQPERPIDEIDLVLPDERLQIEQWRRPDRTFAPIAAADLLGRRAAQSPHATAVTCGDESITYGDLDRRIERLARLLVQRGIGPEDVVAVALPRCIDMVVAPFAIWRAGAVYMPIDAEHPSARVAGMLEDSAAVLVLTDAYGATRLSGSAPCLVLDAGATTEALSRCGGDPISESDKRPPLHMSNAAYVIYTSGSTGTPKGVVISQAALTALIDAIDDCLPMRAGDRHVAVAAAIFDMSVSDLCVPLTRGAELVLATRDEVHDPALLVRRVGARAATTLQATPTLVEQIAEHHASALRGMRVLLGGEALRRDLSATLQRHGAIVLNGYGPTETAIYSTMHVLSEMETSADAAPVVSIGRPLPGERLYVLDERLECTPIGVTGELYIGGTGVGRGYLRRAAFTAERFVPDPFGAPGARMYRTGDLVKWRQDGALMFVGRNDDQAKIHGFRVELGEVEAALVRHDAVLAAAATVRRDADSSPRLLGYVVLEPGRQIDPRELRRHAQSLLPEYMVPVLLTVLDALPRTATGKLNRQALPIAVDAPAPASRPPTTPAQETLCAVAARVLNRPNVGIDDDFFELGGDSILAIRLTIDAQHAGLTITPRDVFEHRTVAALAALAAVTHADEQDGQDAGAVDRGASTAERSASSSIPGKLTPANVPLVSVTQDEIDRLERALSHDRRPR